MNDTNDDLRRQLAKQKEHTQEALYFHMMETEPRQKYGETIEQFALRKNQHREFFHRRSEQLTGSRLPDVNPWAETATCPSCAGTGRLSPHSTTSCSTCNGEGKVPNDLLKRAEVLAAECLNQNPRCWKKKRLWALQAATERALSELIDDAGQTDAETLDEQIAEGLHEWINESYDNRH